MKIAEIISFLESVAHPSLQESYDNSVLITGSPDWDCTAVIVSLDVTEEVISEAIQKKSNLIIAHHPVIFRGLKSLTGKNHVERTVIAAIKNDIAVYAIHTNLDNVVEGVSGKMAAILGLQNLRVLKPIENSLKKLYTYVPLGQARELRDAIFKTGAGQIGKYSNCSFSAEGIGTFLPAEGTEPFVGQVGKLHEEKEIKLEIIFPGWLEKKIVRAMVAAHPYEEVAYEVIALENSHPGIGSGIIGDLNHALPGAEFLQFLRNKFKLPLIRHTRIPAKPIKKVALCGGAGSFLITKALSENADAYITGDIKYHEFFDAGESMLLADIGHYESEQYTIDLIQEVLAQKFPNFAVLKTGVLTNPVHYT